MSYINASYIKHEGTLFNKERRINYLREVLWLNKVIKTSDIHNCLVTKLIKYGKVKDASEISQYITNMNV